MDQEQEWDVLSARLWLHDYVTVSGAIAVGYKSADIVSRYVKWSVCELHADLIYRLDFLLIQISSTIVHNYFRQVHESGWDNHLHLHELKQHFVNFQALELPIVVGRASSVPNYEIYFNLDEAASDLPPSLELGIFEAVIELVAYFDELLSTTFEDVNTRYWQIAKTILQFADHLREVCLLYEYFALAIFEGCEPEGLAPVVTGRLRYARHAFVRDAVAQKRELMILLYGMGS